MNQAAPITIRKDNAHGDPGPTAPERDPNRERTAAEEPHGLHVRSIYVRAVREQAREVDAVASTEALDSYGEVVRANWDLKRFKANPVILWAHNRFEDRLPVGRAKDVRVESDELLLTVVFDSVTDFDEQVFQKYLNGTLKGFSVGFNPRSITVEKVDDEDVVVLDDNELFEVSCVPIPSNPEALAKARIRALQAARDAAKPQPNATPITTLPPQPPETPRMPKKGTIKAATDTTCTVGCPHCEEDFEMSVEVMPLAPKKAAELAEERSLRQAAEARIKTLEDRETELGTRLVTLQSQFAAGEIDALIGEKIAPAERDTLLALASVYLSQKDGETKWRAHLDGIKARASMKLLGTSVTGKDPAPPQGTPQTSERGATGTSFALRVAKAASQDAA